MIRLADRANEKGVAWPSVESIAKDCGIGETSVHRVLKENVKDGHLTIEPTKGGAKQETNTYHVHPRKPCTPANAAPVAKQTGATMAPVPSCKSTGATMIPVGVPSCKSTGAMVAPKPSGTVIKPSLEPTRARAKGKKQGSDFNVNAHLEDFRQQSEERHKVTERCRSVLGRKEMSTNGHVWLERIENNIDLMQKVLSQVEEKKQTDRGVDHLGSFAESVYQELVSNL